MHVIKLKVEEERDLYNPFDTEGDLLSDDVKSYVLDRIAERDVGEQIEIHVVSTGEIDKERIDRAFHRWSDDLEQAIKKEHRRNMIQQLWMFAVGVAFIALSLLVQSKVSVIWFTVLSTIGAFSMWEAAGIWIIQNPKLRLRRRINEKIRGNADIKIDLIK